MTHILQKCTNDLMIASWTMGNGGASAHFGALVLKRLEGDVWIDEAQGNAILLNPGSEASLSIGVNIPPGLTSAQWALELRELDTEKTADEHIFDVDMSGCELAITQIGSGMGQLTDIGINPLEPNSVYLTRKDGVLLRDGRVHRSYSVSTAGERGLLGIDFRNDGIMAVCYTQPDGALVVEENDQVLFVQPMNANIHNGGCVRYGPEPSNQHVFVSIGDDGNRDNAQNLNNNLGTIYNVTQQRIKVYGLRNPWRFSISPTHGWIADVGQQLREEVNKLVYPFFNRLDNCGWPVWEGTLNQGGTLNNTGTYVPPIHQYDHSGGRCSITGGYEFNGRYWFGDFCQGVVRSMALDGSDVRDEFSGLNQLTSFALGANELYACTLSGNLYRIS